MYNNVPRALVEGVPLLGPPARTMVADLVWLHQPTHPAVGTVNDMYVYT